jgi:hypothetical protein
MDTSPMVLAVWLAVLIFWSIIVINIYRAPERRPPSLSE